MLKAIIKVLSRQAMRQCRHGRVDLRRSSYAGADRGRVRPTAVGKQSGFTLIELMVVVVVVVILTAIAIGSYQYFADKKDLASAQQETQNIAEELEKFKAKNFSYKGFDASYLYGSAYDATTGVLTLPLNAAQGEQKYTLSLVDLESGSPLTTVLDGNGNETTDSESVLGLSWLITATRQQQAGMALQPNNYDLLLTSTGLRCQSRTNNAFAMFDAAADSRCSDIDSNSEEW